MPKNIFTQIIKKYKDKNNIIDPQEVANYFNVWSKAVINRGRILKLFYI